jgi:hypothetical protein
VRASEDPYHDSDAEEVVPTTQGPIVVNENAVAFNVNRTCEGVMALIATFLGHRSRLNFQLTCRAINISVERNPDLLFSACSTTRNRFFGAAKLFTIRVQEGKYPNYYDPRIMEMPAYHFYPRCQKKIYKELMRKGDLGSDEALDYFCRLIPGGPVAFKAIYTLTPEDAASLTVEDLPGALARGKDKAGNLFFAMRLKVFLEEGAITVIALVFIQNNSGHGWIQQANTLLPQGHIKFNNEKHLNTVLRLIKKIDGDPDLSLFNVPDRLAWRAASVE